MALHLICGLITEKPQLYSVNCICSMEHWALLKIVAMVIMLSSRHLSWYIIVIINIYTKRWLWWPILSRKMSWVDGNSTTSTEAVNKEHESFHKWQIEIFCTINFMMITSLMTISDSWYKKFSRYDYHEARTVWLSHFMTVAQPMLVLVLHPKFIAISRND